LQTNFLNNNNLEDVASDNVIQDFENNALNPNRFGASVKQQYNYYDTYDANRIMPNQPEQVAKSATYAKVLTKPTPAAPSPTTASTTTAATTHFTTPATLSGESPAVSKYMIELYEKFASDKISLPLANIVRSFIVTPDSRLHKY
jgi:hypothetical protein